MKPAISVIVMAHNEKLLTGSLGLTSEGGSTPLIDYEYNGEALAPSLNIFDENLSGE